MVEFYFLGCFTTSCQIFRETGALLLNTRGIISVMNFGFGLIFFLILKIYILRNNELRKKHIQKARKIVSHHPMHLRNYLSNWNQHWRIRSLLTSFSFPRDNSDSSYFQRIKLIAYTIIYEILFQFSPLAIAFMLNQFFNLNVHSSLGAYNVFFTSLQYGITSIYFFRTFKGLKWRRKPREIQWAFTTDFPKDKISPIPGRLVDFLTWIRQVRFLIKNETKWKKL